VVLLQTYRQQIHCQQTYRQQTYLLGDGDENFGLGVCCTWFILLIAGETLHEQLAVRQSPEMTMRLGSVVAK